MVEPGVIKHVYGDKFSLGEPDGSSSDRIVKLSEALTAGGLRAPVLDKIRDGEPEPFVALDPNFPTTATRSGPTASCSPARAADRGARGAAARGTSGWGPR